MPDSPATIVILTIPTLAWLAGFAMGIRVERHRVRRIIAGAVARGPIATDGDDVIDWRRINQEEWDKPPTRVLTDKQARAELGIPPEDDDA